MQTDGLTEIHEYDMPVLRPIPIRTKRSHPVKGLWRWLTTVRQWRLIENWTIELPDGSFIRIPAGFIFDGASIPRIFWAVLSPTGLLLVPSLLHDYGYAYDRLPLCGGGWYQPGAGRAFWDRLLWLMAVKLNGFYFIESVVWLVVRAFGWLPWRGHRRKERVS